MTELPVALRVKRRRDSTAPAQIILETNSRPQDTLAVNLQQALTVTPEHEGASAAPEGPAKKRCRFVLVPSHAAAACVDSQAVAGVQEQPGLAGPVLELWHTSGLSTSATAASSAGPQTATAAQGKHSPEQQADAQQRANVYAAMVQQYLQEEQQQASAGPQQQRAQHRPLKRAQRSSSTPASTQDHLQDALQQPQAAQQQKPNLPAYMTKGMLEHYGMWQGLQGQQQARTGPSTAGPNNQPHAGDSAGTSTDEPLDMEYTYDVYVAAAADGSSAGPHASTGTGSSLLEGVDGYPGTPDAAMDLPVIQVWEDELLQLQQDWALGQDPTADVDSEDSNAEDHYANEYPDEDDGSYQDSMDSSDAEGEQAAPGRYDDSTGIGMYQPGDSSRGRRSRARAQDEWYAGGYGSDGSFDLDDYVSSADEQGEDREEMGPAWLRKHCTGYGGDDGGQAWRSVLAQQFAPGPPH